MWKTFLKYGFSGLIPGNLDSVTQVKSPGIYVFKKSVPDNPFAWSGSGMMTVNEKRIDHK